MSTSDSHRPRITGRKAHREAAEGLVGKGGAVAAGDEHRHMLHLRQLLQAAIEGTHIVGCNIRLVYAQANTHHTARIGVVGLGIDDLLQFIVHLRPGIAVRIAIGLVHLDRGRRGQTCDHLDIKSGFTLRIRRSAIDIDEREMTLEVNTAQVVLNIILIRTINLHEVDGHILPMQAPLIEAIVAVCSSYITRNKRLVIRATILCSMLGDV